MPKKFLGDRKAPEKAEPDIYLFENRWPQPEGGSTIYIYSSATDADMVKEILKQKEIKTHTHICFKDSNIATWRVEHECWSKVQELGFTVLENAKAREGVLKSFTMGAVIQSAMKR